MSDIPDDSYTQDLSNIRGSPHSEGSIDWDLAAELDRMDDEMEVEVEDELEEAREPMAPVADAESAHPTDILALDPYGQFPESYIRTSSTSSKRPFAQVVADDSATSSSGDEGSDSDSDYYSPARENEANKRARMRSPTPPATPKLTIRIPSLKAFYDSQYQKLPKEQQIASCPIDGCNITYAAYTRTMVLNHLKQHHAHVIQVGSAGQDRAHHKTPCPICNIEVTVENIGRHVLEQHLQVPKYLCLKCEQKVAVRSVAGMKTHIRRCGGGPKSLQ